MLTIERNVGERINVLYPTHGNRNNLRTVAGIVEKTGFGPNGPNITVKEDNGDYRTLSDKKIVENL